LQLYHHGQDPLCKDGQRVSKKFGICYLDNVFVHHYGAIKDQKNILDKLEYYRRRDSKFGLVVKDTWSNWKEGEETQWTHSGGSVVPYSGDHPQEILEL